MGRASDAMRGLGAGGGWLHRWMAKNIGAAGAAAALGKDQLLLCVPNAEPDTGTQEEFAALDGLRRRIGWECELVADATLVMASSIANVHGIDAPARKLAYDEAVADTSEADQ